MLGWEMGIEPETAWNFNNLTGAGGAQWRELESNGYAVGLRGLWPRELWAEGDCITLAFRVALD